MSQKMLKLKQCYNEEVDVQQYTIDMIPFSANVARDGDFMVSVYGDSMSPRFPNGSLVLTRPIPTPHRP